MIVRGFYSYLTMSNHRSPTQTDDAENPEDVNTNTTEDWENFAHDISDYGTCTVDMNTFYRILPMKSNRDVMLKYLFLFVFNIWREGWKEYPNEVLTKEVLCALSWHLRLQPWSKIHIHASVTHIYFTPSSYIAVRSDPNKLHLTGILQGFCYSYAQQILVGDSGDGIVVKALGRIIQEPLAKTFGKKRGRVPPVDNVKNSLFTSWRYPVKLMSLLFLREMGEVHVNHMLIENVMRCEMAHSIFRCTLKRNH